jgi:hypothetical protein
MACSQRDANDGDSSIKRSICETIRNGFDPMNTAYDFQLTLDGVDVEYQYFPLRADKMFGVYIPSNIYPDFYQLLKSIALNQTDPKTPLTNALNEWDASFYSQDADSQFTVCLDHKERKDLRIFFGYFNTPENPSNSQVIYKNGVQRIQDDADDADDFDDTRAGILDTDYLDYCEDLPPEKAEGRSYCQRSNLKLKTSF